MHFLKDHIAFNVLGRTVLGLIHTAKSLPGYADCAETTEPEALRFQADLLELRGQIMDMQQKYLGSRKWVELTDADCVTIVRDGERED
jgi:hypothetical protein